MALTIKTIPVLYGKTADDFNKKSNDNLLKKNTIDFKKEMNAMKSILKKSKIS